jgi:hypothetical protein
VGLGGTVDQDADVLTNLQIDGAFMAAGCVFAGHGIFSFKPI